LCELCLRTLLIPSEMVGRLGVATLYEVSGNFVENNLMDVIIMKIATHTSGHLRFFHEIIVELSEKDLKQD
jgi:hypothetical protein